MMDEHELALSSLRLGLVTGAPVDAAALAHVASCAECSRGVDLAETATWLESREETQAMTRESAEPAVEPTALFESALVAALSDHDCVVRRRAAERLGATSSLAVPAISALVSTAGTDVDQQVRAAALGALQQHDPQLALPSWLVEVWAAFPAEAAPYLEGARARLAAAAGAKNANELTNAG